MFQLTVGFSCVLRSAQVAAYPRHRTATAFIRFPNYLFLSLLHFREYNCQFTDAPLDVLHATLFGEEHSPDRSVSFPCRCLYVGPVGLEQWQRCPLHRCQLCCKEKMFAHSRRLLKALATKMAGLRPHPQHQWTIPTTLESLSPPEGPPSRSISSHRQ